MEEGVGEGMRKENTPRRLFLVQPMMIRVCCVLILCLAGAVYCFGLRPLVLTARILFFGIATEGAFTLRQAGLNPKTHVKLEKLGTGEALIWSDLKIHLIEEHGFYQGRESPYRVDLTEAKRILEI